MPLRLLEMSLPGGDVADVPALLDDVPTVDVETSEPGAAVGRVRVLLDARDAESASDKLVGRYGAREGFRLVLLSVEATLPAVERPEKRTETEAEADAAPSGAKRVGPARIARSELYEDVSHAGELTPLYVAMVALSTVVAAIGLLRGDTAIVIGAMVIAPLLGPNIALSLASTLGDPKLAARSLKAIGAGVATAAALSLLLGTVLEVDPSVPEIAGRTRAGLGDIALALAAGAAGTLAFTSGVPAVVVGVMVAVALLPPLVVAGLLVGSGELRLAAGALALVVTNVTCVNLAAVVTFLIQRVRPRTWWEAKRARRATRRAVISWIAMLAILFLLIWFGLVDPEVETLEALP